MSPPHTVLVVSTRGCKTTIEDETSIILPDSLEPALDRIAEIMAGRRGAPPNRVLAVGETWDPPFYVAAKIHAAVDARLGKPGADGDPRPWYPRVARHGCRQLDMVSGYVARRDFVGAGAVSVIVAEPDDALAVVRDSGMPGIAELEASLQERGFVEMTVNG